MPQRLCDSRLNQRRHDRVTCGQRVHTVVAEVCGQAVAPVLHRRVIVNKHMAVPVSVVLDPRVDLIDFRCRSEARFPGVVEGG